MKTTVNLARGVEVFTPDDLFEIALARKGLEYQGGDTIPRSKPIKTYVLDKELLAVLAKHGIGRTDRLCPEKKMFTLVDQNPPQRALSFASNNYWNFRPLEKGEAGFNLLVTLSAGLEINLKKRGIVLWPRASGTFISPVDLLPNLRMFRALVESDNEVPGIAKELVASEEGIVIFWTQLDLGGIRRMTDLFEEFSAGNEEVKQLGRKVGVFDPAPYIPWEGPEQKLFVAEPAQPKILQVWSKQLSEYRACLTV